MSFLNIQNLQKAFDGTPVLNGISLDLNARQTLAVLGRSGGGKTTLLKIVAGLLSADTGSIHLNGENLTQRPPQERGIVYLYQEALLFPHLNVFENVAFGLRLRHVAPADIQNRTEQMLVGLGLADHARKMPTALSGGQRQRVAFGRALIIQPRLLLLDEPFGALDVETRTQMQQLYRRVAQEQGITAIFVTHDLKEALVMGDRWGYLERGNLQIFNTLQAFADSEKTGVRQEIEFWKQLNK
jgi:putrescine transport system ATP-binding protein